MIKEAFAAGANKCVSKMDCTPNLALEIVGADFQRGNPGLVSPTFGEFADSGQHAAPAANPAQADGGARSRLLPLRRLSRNPRLLRRPPPLPRSQGWSTPPSPPNVRRIGPRAGRAGKDSIHHPAHQNALANAGDGPSGHSGARRRRRCFPGARASGAEASNRAWRRADADAGGGTHRAGSGTGWSGGPGFWLRRHVVFPAGNSAGISEAGAANPDGPAGAGGGAGAEQEHDRTTVAVAGVQHVHFVAGWAGGESPGSSRIAHLAGAMEALVKDLQRSPSK